MKIWHARSKSSAAWLAQGLGLPTHLAPEIPNPGSAEFLNLPEQFKKILRLDKPDLIVTIPKGGIDIPVVSLELTKTTPQSQHAKQRVSRIVAAAETGIPAIYIIPAKKKSKGSIYSLGPDLYWGFEKIRHINKVPVFIYEWPDQNGILSVDRSFPGEPPILASSMQNAFNVINNLIALKRAGQHISTAFHDPFISAQVAIQQNRAATANVQVANYTTLDLVKTADLAPYLQTHTAIPPATIKATVQRLPNRIRARDETLFFKPAGRLFEHGNDPYSGMLSFFDYSFCRFGPGVEERNRNLVYMPVNPDIKNIQDEFSSDGYHAFWKDKCPFKTPAIPSIKQQFDVSHHLQYGCVFTKNKPMRILGYFSDLIVFNDSVLVF